jgi:hypothetical protein
LSGATNGHQSQCVATNARCGGFVPTHVINKHTFVSQISGVFLVLKACVFMVRAIYVIAVRKLLVLGTVS